MLVSHRKRFIYLKTRKTAGTSVLAYLAPYCVSESEAVLPLSKRALPYMSSAGIIGARIEQILDPVAWQNHLPAAQVQERLGKTWDLYSKICCIRNPFDKVFSYFWWAHQSFSAEEPNICDIKAKFQAWIVNDADLAQDRYMYTITSDAPCLDFYVRYECLTSDMEKFCRQQDIPFEVEKLSWLKGKFRPRGLPYHEFYTEHTAARVLDAYDREFDWFGYSRDYRD